MKKPYIVCHMVQSIDGRIDCAMVDKISGDAIPRPTDEPWQPMHFIR